MASLMGSSSSSEGAEGENDDGGDGEASVEDASEGEEKAKPPPPQVDGITPKRKSGYGIRIYRKQICFLDKKELVLAPKSFSIDG